MCGFVRAIVYPLAKISKATAFKMIFFRKNCIYPFLCKLIGCFCPNVCLFVYFSCFQLMLNILFSPHLGTWRSLCKNIFGCRSFCKKIHGWRSLNKWELFSGRSISALACDIKLFLLRFFFLKICFCFFDVFSSESSRN